MSTTIPMKMEILHPPGHTTWKFWLCLSCKKIFYNDIDSTKHTSVCRFFSGCVQIEVLRTSCIESPKHKCTMCFESFYASHSVHLCKKVLRFMKSCTVPMRIVRNLNEGNLNLRQNRGGIRQAKKVVSDTGKFRRSSRSSKSKKNMCCSFCQNSRVTDAGRQKRGITSSTHTLNPTVAKNQVAAPLCAFPQALLVVGSVKWKCNLCYSVFDGFSPYKLHMDEIHYHVLSRLLNEKELLQMVFRELKLGFDRKYVACDYNFVLTPHVNSQWLKSLKCRICGMVFDKGIKYLTHEFKGTHQMRTHATGTLTLPNSAYLYPSEEIDITYVKKEEIID